MDTCNMIHNSISYSSVIDCGTPAGLSSSVILSTSTFNSTFDFACDPGQVLAGNTTEGALVRCGADGHWNMGNIHCTGQLQHSEIKISID